MEKRWKKGIEKMMREKREFPKEEFSGFKCVLECSETRCVFFSWSDSLFIVIGVDLGLIPFL